MSMFDGDENGMSKESLYEYIREFLETHKISELLEIVKLCIKYEKGE